MSENTIDYDAKVQEALRQVVRSVLTDTAENGLPGEHHFYVAFKTQADGVDIPAHLISRFPDEMTIVIQHKFWGLKVLDDHFEIGLSFNQKPENLVIPFAAIVGFVDPSVQFALQFQDGDEQADIEPEAVIENNPDDSIETASLDDADQAPDETEEKSDQKSDGDNVVTLDAFRRK